MTISQLNKLIALSRCQMDKPCDRWFILRLERRDCDMALSAFESMMLNKLYLDYGQQIRKYERLEL